MKSREEIDALTWKIITEPPLSKGNPRGQATCGRPANYQDLADMAADTQDSALAWSELKHEFYRYKKASFFSIEPPTTFSREERALMAGVAEYLSESFNLPVPEWVNHLKYFLDEEWDPLEDVVPDIEQYRSERHARSHRHFSDATSFSNPGT